MTNHQDKIICGDALDVMRDMAAKSIPLVIADPPYNIGKAAWDKIPDYLNWCGAWIKAVERIIADNGSLYIFHNDMPVIAKLMAWIESNTALVFKQLITWCKITPDNGFAQQRLSNGTMRNYYGGFTEYILFYTFQDADFNIEMQRKYLCKEWERSGLTISQIKELCGYTGNMPYHWFALTLDRGGKSQWQLPTKESYVKLQTTGFFQRPYEGLREEYEELRYVFNPTWVLDDVYGNSNTWFYRSTTSPDHPTQKPTDLLGNIMRHSSNEGDLVCDPFAGVGSTAIAAIKNNRRYLCIEKEAKYVGIANERIRIENRQLKLDL